MNRNMASGYEAVMLGLIVAALHRCRMCRAVGASEYAWDF